MSSADQLAKSYNFQCIPIRRDCARPFYVWISGRAAHFGAFPPFLEPFQLLASFLKDVSLEIVAAEQQVRVLKNLYSRCEMEIEPSHVGIR